MSPGLLKKLVLIGLWPLVMVLSADKEIAKSTLAVNPVEEFRGWLSLNSAQRDVALQGRPLRQRTVLKAKLEEYQNLSERERESRLTVLELQFYLYPLLRLPVSDRVSGLGAIPAAYKKTVEARLQEWDLLPGEIQKEVLKSSVALHYFMRFDASPQQREEVILKNFSPETRRQLESKVQQWEALPSARRQKISRNVEHFLELPVEEKQKTLKSFSEEEREEMDKTLQSFEKLSPAQRKMCVESFGRLAEMSVNDRKQFLRNAEKWQSMSSQERETWRNLVNALPPLPPDVKFPPLPITPPEPPAK